MQAILETDSFHYYGFHKGQTIEILGENIDSGSLLLPIPLGAYHSPGIVLNASPSYDESLHLDRRYGWVRPENLTIIKGNINNRNIAKQLLTHDE